MKRSKLRKIEAKVKLGLPLTREEQGYHIIHSKDIDMAIVKGGM